MEVCWVFLLLLLLFFLKYDVIKPLIFCLFLALLEVSLPNLLSLRTQGTSGGCSSVKQQVLLAYLCFGTNEEYSEEKSLEIKLT